jgi:glycosyltransferase involved in cell wall biosynthesis
MKADNNLVGVLMMIKNEENSIAVSINSVKDYIKHIIIFDTGSTDRTIEIVKKTCEANNQELHLKEGVFKSFPESRNDAIEFAETVKVKFLLLMDAGDEFKSEKSKNKFLSAIASIPKNINYGLVKQRWYENNKGSLETNDHNDLRFIRNNSNCRYDKASPVHEAFLNVGQYLNLFDIFILFQDRVKYGGSTEQRYQKDIDNLLKAPKTKRNYYFLSQSYMSVDDFKNGFKYNVLSLETNDGTHAAVDEKFTYVRAGYCAMMCKMDLKIVYKYLDLAVKCNNPPIDGFIYYMKVSIDNNCIEKVVPYIETIYNLKKPTDESTLVNHGFYDYTRYNLLSIVTLISGKKMDIGYEACKKAIAVRNLPDDNHNIKIFEQLKMENKLGNNENVSSSKVEELDDDYEEETLFEYKIKNMVKKLDKSSESKDFTKDDMKEIRFLLKEAISKLKLKI